MGNIALPALDVRPAPQQNPLEQFQNLYALKQQMQNAPLQRQALEQQVQNGQLANQSGQLQLQQQQQALKDQQAFRLAMADPSMQGKTIGDVADALAKKGDVSPQMWQQLKKADIDYRQSLATLNKDQIANVKATHDQTQELYNNVMNMPDDQLAANWPQIAQQYDQIQQSSAMPGQKPQLLDPNTPMTKQQLSQFGPMLSMQNAYLSDAMAKRKATADTQLAETNAQNAKFGPSGPAADAKYRFLQQQMAQGVKPSAQDQAWMKGYEKQKTLVPAATANIRLQGYEQSRQYPVFDKKQNATRYVSAEELNRASTEEPGRYSVASYTPQAIGQKTTTTYFTSGKGGQQLTAFNTAMNHLDTLDKLASDLGNSNVQVFNKAAQTWAEQTGNPAPVNFDAAKNAMAGEVAAALKASGATDQEIAKVDQTFSRAQSPMQLKGAIGTYRTLLKGKETNLQQQYKRGMQGNPNFTQPVGTGDSAVDDFLRNFNGK